MSLMGFQKSLDRGWVGGVSAKPRTQSGRMWFKLILPNLIGCVQASKLPPVIRRK